jgi:hypothetical protein
MANYVYTKGKQLIARLDVEAPTTLEALLVSNSYVFSSNHNFVANLVDGLAASCEISVSNYSRQTLTGVSVVEVDTGDPLTNYAYISASNLLFPTLGAGQTVGGVVVAQKTGNNETASLLTYYDIAHTPTNGGDIAINWASSVNGGVLKLS